MRLSGKQARKVVVEKKTTAPDEYNQPVETWNPDTTIAPLGEVWMEKWDQGGKETLESGQIIAVSDVRFKCRFISGLNENEHRINEGGDIFNIQSIKEINRNEGQMLMTEKRDNQ